MSFVNCPSSGRNSLGVKVTCSRQAYHEFELTTAEDLPCRKAMHVKSFGAQSSSCGCNSEGEGVSSSSVILVT
ncbi:hypothetical protein TNCV_52781 [Trichonephila clavipes]|nr:hypothetical protein TNCV_52781 [Trichonephila clavipes]